MGLADMIHHHGLIASDVPGRTDKLKFRIAKDSYIVPADIVSALGEGNTIAGGKFLDRIFPAPKKASKFAKGGLVPVILAGGEYHISPEAVMRAGDGNLKHGHQILKEFVNHVRSENIKKQKNLPGPKE